MKCRIVISNKKIFAPKEEVDDYGVGKEVNEKIEEEEEEEEEEEQQQQQQQQQQKEFG